MNRFHIHKHVDQMSVRLFHKDLHSDKAFENREEYDVLVILKFLTPELVYISNLISKVELSLSDYKELKQELKLLGVVKLIYERKGEIKTEVL